MKPDHAIVAFFVTFTAVAIGIGLFIIIAEIRLNRALADTRANLDFRQWEEEI